MSLAVVIAVGSLSHVALSAARMLAPLMVLQQGASAGTVGMLGAMFFVIPVLGSVHLGRYIDAVGPRFPILLGAALATFGLLLGAALPFTIPLLVVAGLVGTGVTVVYMACTYAASAAADTDRRTRNFSLAAVGYSVSAFVGPVLGGWAMEHLGGARAFLLVSAFPVLAFILALAARSSWPAALRHAQDTRQHRSLRELLKLRKLVIVLVTGAMLGGAQNLFVFVVPIHGTQAGLSPSDIGKVIGAFAAGVILVRAVFPMMSVTIRPRHLIAASLLISALAYAALPLCSDILPLSGLALILGIALGIVQPTVMAILYNVAPADRVNEATGLNVSINTSAQALVPLVFGVVGGAVGITAVCWIFMCGLVANALGILRLSRS